MVDNLYNKSKTSIDFLKDQSERMLSGVVTKYGKDSSEYEMAGGTKKSGHKKQKPKAKVVKV